MPTMGLGSHSSADSTTKGRMHLSAVSQKQFRTALALVQHIVKQGRTSLHGRTFVRLAGDSVLSEIQTTHASVLSFTCQALGAFVDRFFIIVKEVLRERTHVATTSEEGEGTCTDGTEGGRQYKVCWCAPIKDAAYSVRRT